MKKVYIVTEELCDGYTGCGCEGWGDALAVFSSLDEARDFCMQHKRLLSLDIQEVEISRRLTSEEPYDKPLRICETWHDEGREMQSARLSVGSVRMAALPAPIGFPKSSEGGA